MPPIGAISEGMIIPLVKYFMKRLIITFLLSAHGHWLWFYSLSDGKIILPNYIIRKIIIFQSLKTNKTSLRIYKMLYFINILYYLCKSQEKSIILYAYLLSKIVHDLMV